MKEHNMKRIVVLLATLLLSFGLVNGANNVNITVGGMIQDSLRFGTPAQLNIWLASDFNIFGMSLGFEMWSPDGATWSWDPVAGAIGPDFGDSLNVVTIVPGSRLLVPKVAFDMTGFLATEKNYDELGYDTIMCGGVANKNPLPLGALELMYKYNFTVGSGGASDIRTLCFDSCYLPPSGPFLFVDAGATGFVPVTLWTPGGLCVPVTGMRNACPAWSGSNPNSMTINHCASGFVNLAATDSDNPPNTPIFGLGGVTGGGGTAVVQDNGNGSCKVTYTPVAGDVGQAVSISVDVWDAFHQKGDCTPWVINVTVTNTLPTIDCGVAYNPVGKGNPIVKTDIVGDDDDACDVLAYDMVTGPGDIDAVTGVYTWATLPTDVGVYEVCVSVTDGFAVVSCCFTVEVLAVEPYEVAIEKTHQTLQGHFVDVDITMNAGSETMGGFDFLIGYDASGLAFTEAALGDYFVGCGWEYFTYRYNWNGNCGNACPSGLVRVVGMAETNNGPNHPDFQCIKDGVGQTLVTLTFFVSNDRTLECMYLPIRFYWMDCGDNVISVMTGDTLALNRYIFDFEDNHIENYGYGFPGYLGAPTVPCLDGDKVKPVRFIDFINGGIDVVCADSIDARGDINVNGVKNEIADAVMFTNYFISGLSAFGSHIEASIAASDVNADGIALSVADLVYLVRVIVGDANPYPKPLPGSNVDVTAQVRGNELVIGYNAAYNAGAALLTFQVDGTVGTPVLGVDMDVKYGTNGSTFNVLVYNIGSKAIPAGSHELVRIPVDGSVTLIGAEFADYNGSTMDVSVRNLPSSFSLLQNYPNPFNPATTIALNLPVASDWTVAVYNVAGQLVKEFAGHSEAGTVSVVWDGTDMNSNSVASGIYFYKANAEQFSATKKMVLMK
jgi:hypothetical protein